MAPSTAALALRDSFGDRKLPDISRKIKACVACRKLKIKCHIADSKPPCTRCKARGLPCTINRSLQMLLESDASWKEAMQQRMESLEQALTSGARTREEPRASATVGVESTDTLPHGTSLPVEAQPQDEAGLNLQCSLAAFPASSMSGSDAVAHIIATPSTCRLDLISKGILSIEQAKEAFAFYKQHLDPMVHHILTDVDTLGELRSRPAVLTAAVCTVAAFCMGWDAYTHCLDVLKEETLPMLFSQKHCWDEVRALCIGALWLNDVSAALNGLAVQIGSQLDLHRCITKMPHAKMACYERTRLYFLVCICDHHCSLIHGRPPMTQEWQVLKDPKAFLGSQHTKHIDPALVSQLELRYIIRQIYQQFGADVERSVSAQGEELIRLDQQLENCHHYWISTPVFAEGGRPRRTLDFHWHASRLFLYSHVFRGLNDCATISLGVTPSAVTTVKNGLAFVRFVTGAEDPGATLAMLPVYYITILAFACVVLIKSVQIKTLSGIDVSDITIQLRQLAHVAQAAARQNPFNQLLRNIAKGLLPFLNEHLDDAMDQSSAHLDSLEDVGFDAFVTGDFDMAFLNDDQFWSMCPDSITM